MSDQNVINPEHQWRKWRLDFKKLLANITSAGNYSSFNGHHSYANPCLELPGNLTIPLPLQPNDAEAIRNVCRQAPFGRGDETLVDTSVRKTWELDATQFKIRNPTWTSFLQKSILDPALRTLGAGNATAELYKLLLYDEGSFFKPHKDSEKTPGMIGTLVVCLPSKHTGGEVKLSFGDSRETYSTESWSEFGMSSLAWYSDVTHEIQAVRSGYRLVLTYNIVQAAPASSRGSAQQYVVQLQQLQQHLARWRCNPSMDVKRVCCNLDHQYTESSFTQLPQLKLKGRDDAVYQALRKAADAEGFYLFVGNMSHQKEEEVEGFAGDGNTTELHQLYTLDGVEVARQSDVRFDELLDEAQYSYRAPDEREEGEYTGNASMPDIYRYRDTVIVVTPKRDIEHLLASSTLDKVVSLVLDDFEHGVISGFTDEAALKIIKNTLTERTTEPTRGSLPWYRRAMEHMRPNSSLPSIVVSSNRLGARDLFLKATALGATRPDIAQSIWQCIAESGCLNETSVGDLEYPNSEEPPAPTVDWDYWFEGVLSASEGTDALMHFLEVIEAKLDSDTVDPFLEWKNSVLFNKLHATAVWDVKSRELAIKVLVERHEDTDWLQNRFLPQMAVRGTKSFLRGLLVRIAQREAVEVDKTAIFQCLLDRSSDKVKLNLEDLTVQANASAARLDDMAQINDVKGGKDAPCRLFALLVTSTIGLGLQLQADRLLKLSGEKLSGPASKPIPHNEVAACLETILASMEASGMVSMPGASTFTAVVLRRDCQKLNEFLTSPIECLASFPMGESRRRHLESKLGRDRRLNYQTDKYRTGSNGCFSLVVNKQVKPYESDLKRYFDAKASAEKRVLPFRREYVRTVLGDEAYCRIVMMGDIQEMEDSVRAADAAASASASGSPVQSARSDRQPLHERSPANSALESQSGSGMASEGGSAGAKRPLNAESSEANGRNKRTAIVLD